MEYVAGALVIVLALILLVGALTRRVQVTSCCSLSDPARDLRMRAAFENDAPTGRSASEGQSGSETPTECQFPT